VLLVIAILHAPSTKLPSLIFLVVQAVSTRYRVRSPCFLLHAVLFLEKFYIKLYLLELVALVVIIRSYTALPSVGLCPHRECLINVKNIQLKIIKTHRKK